MTDLIDVVQELSLAKSLEEIVEITRHAARELTGADGATFVLREGNFCHYVDEDAIAPLWKGKYFDLNACVSGWAMLHKEAVVIEDIFKDPRIPIDAYQKTFVRSLAMVPIREKAPVGAIGTYWSNNHEATPREVELLQALANSTAIALENVSLVESLRKVNASLENSLDVRDEFFTMASHELKTPVTALKLQLQYLQRQFKATGVLPEAIQKSLDTSVRQTDKLSSLIEQVLDISRIRLEKLELYPTRFDLSKLLRSVIQRFGPAIQAAGCDLRLEIENEVVGKWDYVRMEQVISNLISNAIKYAPEDEVKVLLRSDPAKKSFFLSIVDRGPGISQSLQGKLFQRFEREASGRKVSGFGLGLFLAAQIVKVHGGEIRVDSKPGEGAAFSVEIPLYTRAESALALEKSK